MTPDKFKTMFGIGNKVRLPDWEKDKFVVIENIQDETFTAREGWFGETAYWTMFAEWEAYAEL